MNTRFVLQGIVFIWDDAKSRANHVKHDDVTFEQAVEAFFDPFLILVDASRHDETRNAIIGLDKDWHLLFVVHIELENEAIRIISARKATRSERNTYEA